MRSLPTIAALTLCLLVAAWATGATADAAPARGADPAPRSFAFAIGNGQLAGGPAEVAERLGGFELVVVDGELARADEVAALRDRGAIVLAYLSVGTIERWRSWYPQLKRYRLGAWEQWEDEFFADVSRAKLRAEFTGAIAPPILAKGFDGLFLDNVDMIEARRHRAQRPGMRKLVGELAQLVHADGRLLFAQNGFHGLERLGVFEALDGWNREDVTWTYDFDRRRYRHNGAAATRAALRELRAVGERGLTVTATDYTRGGDPRARDEAVANACAAGALPYVGDIGLSARRLPDPPLTCP
jgi:uncharacterized protein (TIGR01370 family)